MTVRESLLGSRAAALAPSIIRQMNAKRRPSSVDLTLGQPSLPAERSVVESALAEMYRTTDGYTENAGLRELRALIASHHSLPERQSPENVIVTVGTEQGVYLSVSCAIDPGDEVLVPEPGYPAYEGMVTLAGGVPVRYPVRREQGLIPKAEQIGACLTERTRAVVINSPSNPFGTVAPPEELEKIGRLCDAHGLVAVSDEVYSDLVYTGGSAPSIASFTHRSARVGGLSKSCAFCGFRLGYVIADSTFIQKATVAHQMMVTCAPRLSQLMAIEVFKKPELLKAHLPFYATARERVRTVAAELPPDAPLFLGEGAFYAVLDVSNHAREGSMALALQLLEHEDVVVVPGTAFGPNGDWFWRISYAAGAEIASEGMARIARFIRGA